MSWRNLVLTWALRRWIKPKSLRKQDIAATRALSGKVPFRAKLAPGWRLRFLTLRRDCFRCRACGRSPAVDAAVRLQVDHIVPWNHGGQTVLDNLQCLCQACNGGKSDLAAEEESGMAEV